MFTNHLHCLPTTEDIAIVRIPAQPQYPRLLAHCLTALPSGPCVAPRTLEACTQGIAGGLQVSLDMEKAFERVDRSLVIRALTLFDLGPDLTRLLYSWLAPHKYYIPHKFVIGHANHDIHLQWEISAVSEGLEALSHLAHTLAVFRAYGLDINASKSVALIRLVSKVHQRSRVSGFDCEKHSMCIMRFRSTAPMSHTAFIKRESRPRDFAHLSA